MYNRCFLSRLGEYRGGDNLNYTRGDQPEAKYGKVVKKIASTPPSVRLCGEWVKLAPLSLSDGTFFFPSHSLTNTSIVVARNFGESQFLGSRKKNDEIAVNDQWYAIMKRFLGRGIPILSIANL